MSENALEKRSISTDRANEILEIIMSYARLDFEPKTKIYGDENILDAIGAGVNMLGEELKASTVSLLEKEQLLKEVHHRVKNNLQVIISLINLQCDLATDVSNKDSLNGFKNRIKSMALVHEMLYSSTDVSKINLNEYIKNLIQQLSFSFPGNNKGIKFNVEIDETINFEMDKMTPLGLILNEIISNSLAHAFTNGSGEITIIGRIENDKNSLIISDNGKGLPSNWVTEIHGKLGMQLINILCDQIDSSLEISSDGGVKVKMKF